MTLLKMEDGKFDKLLDLSDQDGKRLINDLNLFDQIETSMFLQFDILHDNLSEFISYDTNLVKVIRERGPDFIYDFGIHRIKISKLIMNILTSFLSYIEVTPSLIEKHLPNGTVLAKQFKEYEMGMRHKCFEYRFLRKFRNYVQHNDIPFVDIAIRPQNQLLFDPTGLIELKKSELLNYTGWKELTTEVHQLPDTFILEPYLIKLEECINIIESYFFDLLIKQSSEAIINMLTFYKKIKQDTHEKFFALLIPDPQNNQSHLRFFNISFLERSEKMISLSIHPEI
jgi:hypothetical protein